MLNHCLSENIEYPTIDVPYEEQPHPFYLLYGILFRPYIADYCEETLVFEFVPPSHWFEDFDALLGLDSISLFSGLFLPLLFLFDGDVGESVLDRLGEAHFASVFFDKSILDVVFQSHFVT